MERGKVQTNEYTNNILVEIESENATHGHPSNFHVYGEKMSDDEIKEAYLKLAIEPSIMDMKARLKKEKGYAVSNCNSETIDYGDLFKYELLSILYFDGKPVFVLPEMPGNEFNQFMIYVSEKLGIEPSESLMILKHCNNKSNSETPEFSEGETQAAVDKWLDIIKKHSFPVLT